MSWLSRLKEGLSKTSSGISSGISDIFTKRRLDEEALEELEELLIQADLGAKVAAEIVAEFGEGRFDKEIAPEEVRRALAELIAQKLAPVAVPLSIRHCERSYASEESDTDPSSASGLARDDMQTAMSLRSGRPNSSLATASENLSEKKSPHVILVVGVNGNGKTTTIGKLAAQFKDEGKRVLLGAADTFRAAAVEQLQKWGERSACEVVIGAAGADPASVAYQALEKARADGADVLLIDTAGRLHNKANLMEELKKMVRVLKKLDDSAPHTVLQVLDATTGQNALQQVKAFQELIDVNGLIVTKLDGTAKAGVVVALAEQFHLPIHAVGVGEGKDDLQSFIPSEFAASLVG